MGAAQKTKQAGEEEEIDLEVEVSFRGGGGGGVSGVCAARNDSTNFFVDPRTVSFLSEAIF